MSIETGNSVRRWIRYGLAAGLFMACASGYARELQVELQSEQIYTGQSVTLSMRLTDAKPLSDPEMTGLPQGLTSEFLGTRTQSSTYSSVINGRQTTTIVSSYLFSFRITGVAPGRYRLPPITIELADGEISSDPLSLTVRAPEKSEDYELVIEPFDTSFYLGEPISLTVSWYLREQARPPAFTLPFLETLSGDWETAALPVPKNGKVYDVALNDRQVSAVFGQEQRGGEDLPYLRFMVKFFPDRTGNLVLGPCSAAFEGLNGYRTVSNLWGQSSRQPNYAPFVIPGNDPVVKVIPLPGVGRPADFSGLVGHLEVRAEAAPLQVRVGDPVTLRVFASGIDPLEKIDLDLSADRHGFDDDFKVPEEQSLGRLAGDEMVFTQTLRAKDASVETIPPLRFSYFDPETGRYAFAATQAIDLDVSATREVTGADLEGGGAEQPLGKTAEVVMNDIRVNIVAADFPADRNAVLLNPLHNPTVLILLGLPPLMALVLIGRRRFLANYGRFSRSPAGLRLRLLKQLDHLIRTPNQEQWRECEATLNDYLVRVYAVTLVQLGRSVNVPPGWREAGQRYEELFFSGKTVTDQERQALFARLRELLQEASL